MITRTLVEIAADIRGFTSAAYPDMEIRVEPDLEDPSRTAIYFTESKFALIYPTQRFHYLSHLIPAEYQEQHLQNTAWFELAPGETPADLVYPDDELVRNITPDVMRILRKTGFFELLDNQFSPLDPAAPRAQCWGDYRVSRGILPTRGFSEDEFFDVFHVLMAQGGFCDCEILHNACEESRLKAEYWKARAQGHQPRDPHSGGSA